MTTLVLTSRTYVSQCGYSFVCGDGEIIGLQRERSPVRVQLHRQLIVNCSSIF